MFRARPYLCMVHKPNLDAPPCENLASVAAQIHNRYQFGWGLAAAAVFERRATNSTKLNLGLLPPTVLLPGVLLPPSAPRGEVGK